MAELVPYTSGNKVEVSSGSFDPTTRQAELNQQGRGMVDALTRGIPDMLRGGIVEDVTKSVDRAFGVKKYSTTPSHPEDFVGGWRKVTINDEDRLIKVIVAVPDGSRESVERVAEIHFADPKMTGATKLPRGQQYVRAAIDRQDVPHVSGKRDALKFNVDDSNARSMHADLNIAGKSLEEAAAGLAVLESGIPAASPEWPEAPTAPLSDIVEPPKSLGQ